MRLWALLAALLLTSLVLAGCSDGGDDDDDATSSTSSTSRASSSASSTGSTSTSGSTTSSQPGQPAQEPDNAAPVGSMAAAPLANVSKAIEFTLNGTDPDGDNIVWDFSFGDSLTTSGAVLPATFNHTYAAMGLYNASFTISDGRLQTTYNLTVNVTAGGAAGTLFAFTETATGPGNPLISAEIPGLGWCGATCCPGFDAGESGAGCVFTALPSGLDGKTFTATSDVGDVDLEFWATCDASELFSITDFRNAGPETGIVAAGAGCVVLWDNAVPPSAPTFPTFTFTVA